MTKIDFEKVEKAFEKGVLKLMIDRLIELSEMQDPDAQYQDESGESALETLRKRVLTALHRDLKRLSKKDSQALETAGLDPSDIKKYVKDPSALSAEDWQKIKAIKAHVDKYKQEAAAAQEKDLETNIVEKERVRQKNKRFNVRDGWLPLH
jgi:hypothetical protein